MNNSIPKSNLRPVIISLRTVLTLVGVLRVDVDVLVVEAEVIGHHALAAPNAVASPCRACTIALLYFCASAGFASKASLPPSQQSLNCL
eukprot:1882416-Amphidinium_carterae.1